MRLLHQAEHRRRPAHGGGDMVGEILVTLRVAPEEMTHRIDAEAREAGEAEQYRVGGCFPGVLAGQDELRRENAVPRHEGIERRPYKEVEIDVIVRTVGELV